MSIGLLTGVLAKEPSKILSGRISILNNLCNALVPSFYNFIFFLDLIRLFTSLRFVALGAGPFGTGAVSSIDRK